MILLKRTIITEPTGQRVYELASYATDAKYVWQYRTGVEAPL